MPIREGDGTPLNVKGFTEVREGDGTVLWQKNAIPDSGDLHARYDATEISATDGDSISTWADQTGNGHDLTAGSAPTFKSSIINGNPVVRFDGADDYLDVDFADLSQPNQYFIVFRLQSTNDSVVFTRFSSTSGGRNVLQIFNGNWRLFAGSSIDGSAAATGDYIHNALFDGASSKLRINGSLDVSGDPGSDGQGGLTLGARQDGDGNIQIDIGEVLIYPQDKTGVEAEAEQYLSDKWGVTL
jgi:hypothetical protein